MFPLTTIHWEFASVLTLFKLFKLHVSAEPEINPVTLTSHFTLTEMCPTTSSQTESLIEMNVMMLLDRHCQQVKHPSQKGLLDLTTLQAC